METDRGVAVVTEHVCFADLVFTCKCGSVTRGIPDAVAKIAREDQKALHAVFRKQGYAAALDETERWLNAVVRLTPEQRKIYSERLDFDDDRRHAWKALEWAGVDADTIAELLVLGTEDVIAWKIRVMEVLYQEQRNTAATQLFDPLRDEYQKNRKAH